jgi:hypothetical protein
MQVWSGSSTTDVVRVFMTRGECAVTAASGTIDLDIDITRRMLRQGRARALVVGTERATGSVLRSLRADFGAVVVNMRAGGPLTLPETRATVILHDVSVLNAADQARLSQWLNLSPPGISVIGVTSEPMFPLVQRGAFLTDLFYRLNLVVIDVTDRYI